MKLICEKDKILKALNSVTKAVAVRTTMPWTVPAPGRDTWPGYHQNG